MNLDQSAGDFLGDKFGTSNFSNYEIYMIGEALVNWLGTTLRLGHSSPGMTLDYTRVPGLSLGALIIRDVIAWTSHRTHLADGCEERLRSMLADADMDGALSDKVGALLAGDVA